MPHRPEAAAPLLRRTPTRSRPGCNRNSIRIRNRNRNRIRIRIRIRTMPESHWSVSAAFVCARRELGPGGSEALSGVALADDVCSDIRPVESRQGPVGAKRASPRLRVAADRQAPVAQAAQAAASSERRA